MIGYNPYNFTQPMMQSSLIRVNGMDGARMYQMQPNSTVALFDAGEDLFYIKTTDGAGFPTIRTFKFSEVTSMPQVNTPGEYITKAEFEKFKEDILNGQFTIHASTNTATDAPSKSRASGNGKTVITE